MRVIRLFVIPFVDGDFLLPRWVSGEVDSKILHQRDAKYYVFTMKILCVLGAFAVQCLRFKRPERRPPLRVRRVWIPPRTIQELHMNWDEGTGWVERIV
jgi:hypothetical protein